MSYARLDLRGGAGGISNEGGAEGACRRHALEEKKQKILILFQGERYGFR